MNVLKHRILSDEDVMQVIKPTHLCDIGNQIPHCILLASIKWVKLFGLWSVFLSIGEEVTRGPITAYHMPSWNWGISTSNFYYLLSIIRVHPRLAIWCIVTCTGYSAWKLMGVCRWPLKIGPKKIEEKIEFGAKKIDFCKNW